jgi:hypothetical protein
VLPAKGRYHETGIEPGHVEYLVLQMPAGMETSLHHDDTINFYTVVAGSLDVLLDDGPHRLNTGDNLVVPGVDHGWTVGPSGCTMTILNLGQYGPSERRSITHSAFRAPRVLGLGRSHGPYPHRAVAASQSSPELRYRRTP